VIGSALVNPGVARHPGRATLVAFSLLLVAGCRGAHTGSAPARLADRRAILLDAEQSYWRTHAPELFRATVETSKGVFVIEGHRAWAPLGADRFYNLARAGFFDDSRFFRVMPNYIAQFGIPGDPAITTVWKDRTFPDDPVRQSNVRGTIGFAMTGPNMRTTQLYISRKDNVQLDAQGFAPIGRVVTGMEVVDALYDGYGESAGGGVRAGKQQRMLTEGNAHLDRDFPKLDRITRITVR
jgi:cyclophilin family peptidyl-prolyl cis-trans isomerase